ncbi:tRNA preQ1(34) S-adenosylmethionine ribosyltransferase-isomerase QueA [Ilumatobacteraceae bacterium]|nr:tRNA preQ1(34) S-adenosylmethionine ribosyltransferase-isomerase QueA [Ilumatobacteraceae bacterium]
MNYRIEDFDYDLPTQLIAQQPVEPRTSARLLVDRGQNDPWHRHVSDLPSLLQPGDLLVVNDTRVIPARVGLRRKSGGHVEMLLLESLADGAWECLLRPGRRISDGEVLLDLEGNEVISVEGRHGPVDSGTFRVQPLIDRETLFTLGSMPLPPYIHTSLDDPSRYQTVYSRRPASAAAPTAGLHFTNELIAELEGLGVELARVELVVGLDTFRPLTVSDLADHRMHTESYEVPESTIEACQRAERVIAVGTTAARALESAAHFGQLSGRTDLFITPSHEWKLVDLLLTNFHMPRTTLLVMIESLVGPRWRDLYQCAVNERYRMLSFGDAMLLDRRA